MLDRAEAQMRGLGCKLEIPAGEDQLHEYQMQLTAYERFEKAATNGEIKVDWVQKRPDDHWGSGCAGSNARLQSSREFKTTSRQSRQCPDNI
jgi:hypothetical protein